MSPRPLLPPASTDRCLPLDDWHEVGTESSQLCDTFAGSVDGAERGSGSPPKTGAGSALESPVPPVSHQHRSGEPGVERPMSGVVPAVSTAVRAA